jgi:hypothetical protein
MEQNQSQGTPQKQGTIYVVLGWVFFGISLLFIPLIFGAGSFVMGFLVRKQPGRETHGVILMVFAVAGALLGMIIGAATAGY